MLGQNDLSTREVLECPCEFRTVSDSILPVSRSLLPSARTVPVLEDDKHALDPVLDQLAPLSKHVREGHRADREAPRDHASPVVCAFRLEILLRTLSLETGFETPLDGNPVQAPTRSVVEDVREA